MRRALLVAVGAGAVVTLAGCGGSSAGAHRASSPAPTSSATTPAATPTPSGTPDPNCKEPTSTPAQAASYDVGQLLTINYQTISQQLAVTYPLMSARYFSAYQSEIQRLQSQVTSTKTVEDFAVSSVTYVSGDCTVPVYRVVGVQTSHQGSSTPQTSTITLKAAMLLSGTTYVVDEIQPGT